MVKSNRGLKNFFVFLLILTIISFMIYPSLFYGNWPYIIISLFILLFFSIKNKKTWSLILIVLFLSSMTLMQAFFYFIIPLYNNYQPTPSLPLMKMFNIDGKFQVSYYPDLPKAGDNIILYLDVCNLDSSKCNKCSICNLSGSFIDEKNEEKFIFQNISLNETEYIDFVYPGRRVKVTLSLEGIDKRSNKFYIPKLNFSETILLFLEEHPVFRWISIISVFAFISAMIISIKKVLNH